MSSLLQEAAREAGCHDPGRVQDTVEAARRDGRPVLAAVLESGAVEEEPFLEALAARLGCAWTADPKPCPEQRPLLLRVCRPGTAVRHGLLPLAVEGDPDDPSSPLRLACADPFDRLARQVVSREIDRPVRWTLAPRRRIVEALQRLYGVGADTFEGILQGREGLAADLEVRDEATVLDGSDAEASVVRFVNEIIRDALEQRATDIHVEPTADSLRIRQRVDGVLQEMPVPENIKALQSSVIARIKVMARLDIAEKRLPQDGRIALQLDGRPIDVRVATIPSVEGESVSLRLLGQETFTLDRLAFLPEARILVDRLLRQPNGIVLVTGPTGSGKSTTLYSFLAALNDGTRRIVTVEDPVEHKLSGVVQIAVRPEIQLTFAAGLRSILRSDPNVIMVGEIRDLETAEIAIRSALTGHLVFSTLHTNDAIGGITRLIDMGIEPFLVGASVRAFIGQRLVRRLCPHCRQPADHRPAELEAVGFPRDLASGLHAPHPGGCERCRGTGYRGRLAIYEVCVVTPALQDAIVAHLPQAQLLRQAQADGYTSMRAYGWRKAAVGETTLEEVLAATAEERTFSS
jgi:type II secretory ATPase GspE/PulE/Tfp pilus assembly ATPase PilB-like protein